MNKDQIDSQKVIVNDFEENLYKSIKQLFPLGDNRFIVMTDQQYPNKFYLAEYYSEEDKPSLLKGEKKGPALVIKDLVYIEAHKDIKLGEVDQSGWENV